MRFRRPESGRLAKIPHRPGRMKRGCSRNSSRAKQFFYLPRRTFMATEGYLLRVWRSKHAAVKKTIGLLECTLGLNMLESCTRESVEKLLRTNQNEAKLYCEIIQKLEHKGKAVRQPTGPGFVSFCRDLQRWRRGGDSIPRSVVAVLVCRPLHCYSKQGAYFYFAELLA